MTLLLRWISNLFASWNSTPTELRSITGISTPTELRSKAQGCAYPRYPGYTNSACFYSEGVASRRASGRNSFGVEGRFETGTQGRLGYEPTLGFATELRWSSKTHFRWSWKTLFRWSSKTPFRWSSDTFSIGIAFQFSLILIVLFFCSSVSRALEISTSEYSARLSRIQSALESKDLPGAQKLAVELNAATISSASGPIGADGSLLLPVINAKKISDTAAVNPRLKVLRDALGGETLSETATADSRPVSRDALERLRRDERVDLPSQDGQVSGGEIIDSRFFKELRETIMLLYRWFYDLGDRFLKWLDSLFPKSVAAPGIAGMTTMALKMLIVAFAIAAAVMVIYILMRNQKNARQIQVSSGAVLPASSKDADPTSRDAAQWEDYAAKLAAAGRHREAIRACYHAVLATLFRSGVLHYRKGRTNWEYCYALPLNIPWRDRFFDLTGFFEIEWYGKIQSEPEDFSTYVDATRKLLSQTRGGGKAVAA